MPSSRAAILRIVALALWACGATAFCFALLRALSVANHQLAATAREVSAANRHVKEFVRQLCRLQPAQRGRAVLTDQSTFQFIDAVRSWSNIWPGPLRSGGGRASRAMQAHAAVVREDPAPAIRAFFAALRHLRARATSSRKASLARGGRR